MREFAMIVVAGIVSAVLSAGFGWLIGRLSPEFIQLLAAPIEVKEPERLATAIGVVSGLMIGAAAMVVGLIVSAIRGRANRPR
jgi:hypothetical protein